MSPYYQKKLLPFSNTRKRQISHETQAKESQDPRPSPSFRVAISHPTCLPFSKPSLPHFDIPQRQKSIAKPRQKWAASPREALRQRRRFKPGAPPPRLPPRAVHCGLRYLGHIYVLSPRMPCSSAISPFLKLLWCLETKPWRWAVDDVTGNAASEW